MIKLFRRVGRRKATMNTETQSPRPVDISAWAVPLEEAADYIAELAKEMEAVGSVAMGCNLHAAEQAMRAALAWSRESGPAACSALLCDIGAPCSLYREYTLRVEVKVAGAWHADTNWSEIEVNKALLHAEKTRNDKRRKVEDVRVIRMRFEVVEGRVSHI
jgi:hypothetical protein